MIIPSDPFYHLLEHYLSGAACKFIHLIKPDEQNRLINLISLVNADINSLASEARQISDKEKEEQIAISESAKLISGDNHWLVVHVRKQTQRQEAYIRHLENAIHMTESCGQYIDSRFHAEPARSTMLERNKRILRLYQQHLATTKINQDTLHHQLSRLTTC